MDYAQYLSLGLSTPPDLIRAGQTAYSRRVHKTDDVDQIPPDLPPSAEPDLMASSEVDQKFLAKFAKMTAHDNPYLSSFLYKVLGLSVILSKKLVRARRHRKLDTTRDTKSLQLYHHIIWLSREGLVMVEQYIIPMVQNYTDLKVLSYKLRASFYHIFVLFHNTPPATQAAIPALPGRPSTSNGIESTSNGKGKGKAPMRERANTSSSRTEGIGMGISMNGGPVGGLPPPGLSPVAVPQPTSSFLLPAIDYIPLATSCFEEASSLADHLLSGSHPMRLSVKVEYAAFIYDCLRDGHASGLLAKHTIADVYNAQEGMDDETFEDAAELVGLLGKMMKRGLGGGGGGGGSTGGSTPAMGGGSSSTNGGSKKTTPRSSTTPKFPTPTTPKMTPRGLPPAVPSPGMTNPI